MKKCIALVLALVLMIGILPCGAFAEDAPEKGILAVFSSPKAQIVSGSNQSKLLADTVIYLYTDTTFVQYVSEWDHYEVYSEGTYELNFDWNDSNWRDDGSLHVLTLRVKAIHDTNHQLQPADITYDINLDTALPFCLYPANVRSDLKLVAAFMQVDKQKLVRQDGTETYLPTMWFYYDDGTFQQYALLDGHKDELFSTGDYRITEGGFAQGESVLTIHRTQKYRDGIGLADYDSTHDYVIEELDFVQVFPERLTGKAPAVRAGEIDEDAFDALVAGGPVADEAAIAASQWASAVRERGSLRVGTTVSSVLFSSQKDEESGVYGFDAGLYQMLARYIFGDASAVYLVHVTSPLVSSRTRENVLLQNLADAVFSTYSILPKRQEIISFAGPYFTTRQAVLVKAGNTEITGYEALAGKTVAVQGGTSVMPIMAEYAPDAVLLELTGDDECLAAVASGRADAYVSDFTLLASATIEYPGVFEINGELFGPNDNYGVGLPLDSDGVAFVNEFLRRIEADGTWTRLWKICFGDRIGGADSIPEPPAIPE